MIAIHAEITAVEIRRDGCEGEQSMLKNAPHTADVVSADRMESPLQPRAGRVSGAIGLRDFKFWPAVGRVDNVFGDRNLVCSCVGMEAYSA